MRRYIFFLGSLFLFLTSTSKAQEVIGPVQHNAELFQQQYRPLLKTTTLSLPFFDDFTDKSPFPNPSKWMEAQVYVNNTMSYCWRYYS